MEIPTSVAKNPIPTAQNNEATKLEDEKKQQ